MHASGFEREFSAGIHEVAIDDDPRPLAKPHSRLFAEAKQEAGRRPGADQISHEYRGIALERAACRARFGKTLSFDFFDHARRFCCLRLGAAQSRQRQSNPGRADE